MDRTTSWLSQRTVFFIFVGSLIGPGAILWA